VNHQNKLKMNQSIETVYIADWRLPFGGPVLAPELALPI
jgi:hypothetical protein